MPYQPHPALAVPPCPSWQVGEGTDPSLDAVLIKAEYRAEVKNSRAERHSLMAYTIQQLRNFIAKKMTMSHIYQPKRLRPRSSLVLIRS